ncbi:MAG TPA: hypothetical protein VKA76_08750 [Gammaproteobacteria bacterium]|nr:hypothetical protein [Gammaproteobacteria bacterium]
MIRLANAAGAWGRPDFNDVLKAELEQLDNDALPLQAGLSTGSYVTDHTRQAMIISVADDGQVIRAKAGIFYTGILTGCACADDPTPVNEESEYCEVQLDIHKVTGETEVVLVGD